MGDTEGSLPWKRQGTVPDTRGHLVGPSSNRLRGTLRRPCPTDSEEDTMNEGFDPTHSDCPTTWCHPWHTWDRTQKTRVGAGGVASTAREADALLCLGKHTGELVTEASSSGHPQVSGTHLSTDGKVVNATLVRSPCEENAGDLRLMDVQFSSRVSIWCTKIAKINVSL